MIQTDVTSFVNSLDLGPIQQAEIYGDQAPVLATPAIVCHRRRHRRRSSAPH